jgi:hypothetical protein
VAAQLESEVASIRTVIERELRQVAVEHGKTLATLTDGLRLSDSGLDSLSLAIVTARLEDVLGVDPFALGKLVESPVTWGDFVRMYERVLPLNATLSTNAQLTGDDTPVPQAVED